MNEYESGREHGTHAEATGVALHRPIIVSALYLAGLFTGFTVLIGVILAHVWRREPDAIAWEKTHFTYLIRTFWLGLAMWVALFAGVAVLALVEALGQVAADPAAINPVGDEPPASVILATFAAAGIAFLVFVWSCVRSILSLAKAASRRPMPRPKTWLF